MRIDRMVEGLDIITRLLQGETVTHHGDHYQVTSHTLHPRSSGPGRLC